MGLLCGCPPSAALSNVDLAQCKESIGQIQKLIFQRRTNAAGVKNVFKPNATSSPTDPALLAGWTPLLAATNGTKVVQSPFVTEPTSEPGAAREYGGGNATLGGIPIIVGREPSTFTGQFLTEKQSTIKQLKTFECEDLAVFYVDEFGRIVGDSNGLAADDDELEIFGFPIASFFVGDKQFGQLEEPDRNMIMFRHFPNWSDNLVVVTPEDFNALTDLKTPA